MPCGEKTKQIISTQHISKEPSPPLAVDVNLINDQHRAQLAGRFPALNLLISGDF